MKIGKNITFENVGEFRGPFIKGKKGTKGANVIVLVIEI